MSISPYPDVLVRSTRGPILALSFLLMWLLSLTPASAARPPLVDVLRHPALPQSPLLPAQLLPLGFSPQGLMAVLHVPPDEAIGCFLWEVQIINLVDDAVVESLRWQDAECEQIISLSTLWAAKGATIQALLNRHRIASGDPLSLQTFPLSRRGDSLTVDLWPQPPQVSVEEGGTVFQVPLQVRVRSTQRGEKSVGTVSVTFRFDLPWTWGQEVVGYLQSPFEERIVIVVREVQRGWEGPPNVETIYLFGADLQKGF